MNIKWDKEHGEILSDFLKRLSENNIRWFILRGYEGLPNENQSKDVDIMIEVGKEKEACGLLKETFKKFGLKYFYSVTYGHAHCYLGMDDITRFSIHIDLIEGYISKGYEVFTFEELWSHVTNYNGLNVLDDFMNGIMLLVYKIFGYHHARLKPAYKVDILKAQQSYPKEFKDILLMIAGNDLGLRINDLISQSDFEAVLALEPEFTKALKRYTWKKRPVKTISYVWEFVSQKVSRIVFHYKKYAKTFAVMAPDGTGKTTFLDALLEQLNFYYVNNPEDNRFHLYHFRPSLLPNLGEVGEKAGVMKQDTDFTNPHRSKPANPLSSLFRISYYTLDYIIGWQRCVRNDVHYDRYTVFDRYSYDFIVDPKRTKLNLPEAVRKFFVKLTPQPGIVFCLNARPEVVYKRKQELSLEEIRRQSELYKKVAESDKKRFVIIDAERTPNEMANQAVQYILSKYTEKL